MMVRKSFILILTLLFFSQTQLLKASGDEKSFIEDLGRRAINSLTNPGVSQSELESKFKNLLEEGFDIQAIGRFVMGRNWRRMTQDQKDRFIPIFEKRLIKSYANRFQEYRGVDFKVKDARTEGRHVVVTSTIQKPGGPVTPVDWRVKDGKIHDVKVEGVSMSITIRDDYNARVQSSNGNIDAFLNELSALSGDN